MKTKTALTFVLVLFGAATVSSLILYASLPERVPTHWNLHGEVDGWSGRPFACLVMPVLILICLFFMLAGDWFSPANFKVGAFRSAFNYLMVIVTALVLYLHAMVLTAALHPDRPLSRWILGGLFLFIAWVGNMLGKTRRNFWIGIRTPWTLASDAVWIATHRLGARVFMVTGILGAVGIALGLPPTWCFAMLFVGICVPLVYSFWLSKKLERQEHQRSA